MYPAMPCTVRIDSNLGELDAQNSAETFLCARHRRDSAVCSPCSGLRALRQALGRTVRSNALGPDHRLRRERHDYRGRTGRFHLTDITYVIPEDLYINGSPGGPFTSDGNILVARPSARLRIDPGVVVKLSSSRIEARIGSQLIAEGTSTDPIIFTALTDTRFGAGGTRE